MGSCRSCKIAPMYQNRKYLKWQDNNPDPLLQRQWNTLFMNLYNKVKQKDSFDVRYKFLHFAQSTAIKLDTNCPRCGEQEDPHEHWLFSPIFAEYPYIPSIYNTKSLHQLFTSTRCNRLSSDTFIARTW